MLRLAVIIFGYVMIPKGDVRETDLEGLVLSSRFNLTLN